MITFKELIQKIEDWVEAHPQINGFHFGTYESSTSNIFPLLNVSVVSGNSENSIIFYETKIEIFDLLEQDLSNKLDNFNQGDAILRDFKTFFWENITDSSANSFSTAVHDELLTNVSSIITFEVNSAYLSVFCDSPTGATLWGAIKGDMVNQTDLMAYFHELELLINTNQAELTANINELELLVNSNQAGLTERINELELLVNSNQAGLTERINELEILVNNYQAEWGDITGDIYNQTDLMQLIEQGAITDWGTITGSLGAQTDLKVALEAAAITDWGTITGSITSQADIIEYFDKINLIISSTILNGVYVVPQYTGTTLSSIRYYSDDTLSTHLYDKILTYNINNNVEQVDLIDIATSMIYRTTILYDINNLITSIKKEYL